MEERKVRVKWVKVNAESLLTDVFEHHLKGCFFLGVWCMLEWLFVGFFGLSCKVEFFLNEILDISGWFLFLFEVHFDIEEFLFVLLFFEIGVDVFLFGFVL